MARLYANRASTTLVGNISDTATSWTVADGSLFPAPTAGDFAVITIEQGATFERVHLTARTGGTFTVVRGQDGTAAAAFTDGARVVLRNTESAMERYENNLGLGRYVPAGRYWYPLIHTAAYGTSTTVPSLNEIYAMKAVVNTPNGIDRLALFIQTRDTVNADAVARFGVYAYDPATDSPGALIADGGTVSVFNAGGGGADVEVVLSAVVPPGPCYLAIARQGTANVAAFRIATNTNNLSLNIPSAASLATLGAQRSAIRLVSVSGAFPNPFGTPSGLSDTMLPLVARSF